MEQNKTGKYFKYAIGEVVLVVIGILIALSINNWNEGRKRINQGKNYVNEINNDVKNDMASIKNILDELTKLEQSDKNNKEFKASLYNMNLSTNYTDLIERMKIAFKEFLN